MSGRAMKWAAPMRPVYKGKLDPLGKALLVWLAQRVSSDDDNVVWWPEDKMRAELCMGRDAFRDRKTSLKDQGYITIEEYRYPAGPRKGQRGNDRWHLVLEREPDEAPVIERNENLAPGGLRRAKVIAMFAEEAEMPRRRRGAKRTTLGPDHQALI